MKNALILCDLDGTLFDTAEVNFYAYKEAMEELDYHLEHEYYVNQCNGRHYATFLPKIVPSQEHIKQIHKRKK
ncbi:HAD hydrolase-like protein, partial [Sedimentibacter sp.]|uniref:HAD hydrolase-like protein n=1 Tax=Sedimentibacter sp. TaxID=1960295 RepID=UPI0028993FB2